MKKNKTLFYYILIGYLIVFSITITISMFSLSNRNASYLYGQLIIFLSLLLYIIIYWFAS
jgi:hypothetical protein